MAPQDMAAELASTCDASPSARRARVSDLAARMLSKTSKQSSDPAILLLADGTAFYGRSCGAAGAAVGAALSAVAGCRRVSGVLGAQAVRQPASPSAASRTDTFMKGTSHKSL